MPLNIEREIKMQFFDPGSIFRCEILNSCKILNPGLKYYGSEILTPPPPVYSCTIGEGFHYIMAVKYEKGFHGREI